MTTLTTTIGQIVRGDREVFPPYLYAAYQSTKLRAPALELVEVPLTLSELTGPGPVISRVTPEDADMTRNAGTGGEAIGQRIIVTGRVLDDDGRPIGGTLVEIWQANAGGRYRHEVDQHPSPLDPNFSGAGRCLTDPDGCYRFVTIKPGSYPWGNHENAWRPQHIHFSVFGRQFTQRLVTQMYFPGDPLMEYDPIATSVRDPKARALLVARFDLETTQPEWALGYQWDIVLGRAGAGTTPLESA